MQINISLKKVSVMCKNQLMSSHSVRVHHVYAIMEIK